MLSEHTDAKSAILGCLASEFSYFVLEHIPMILIARGGIVPIHRCAKMEIPLKTDFSGASKPHVFPP